MRTEHTALGISVSLIYNGGIIIVTYGFNLGKILIFQPTTEGRRVTRDTGIVV